MRVPRPSSACRWTSDSSWTLSSRLSPLITASWAKSMPIVAHPSTTRLGTVRPRPHATAGTAIRRVSGMKTTGVCTSRG